MKGTCSDQHISLRKSKQFSRWKAAAQINRFPYEHQAIFLMTSGCSDQYVSFNKLSDSLYERRLLRSIDFLKTSESFSYWKAAAQINTIHKEKYAFFADERQLLRSTDVLFKKSGCSDQSNSLRKVSHLLGERQLLRSIVFHKKSMPFS